jgi:epoxyqueuosine reductase QueG
MIDAVRIAEDALQGTGVNLFGSCSVAAWDARAPAALRSCELMPRARGVVVAASAGPELWAGFRAEQSAHPQRWDDPNPLDAHVARLLDRADVAFARARIGSRRFEAAVGALPALDFRALGEIAGLGSLGPFGLLIHPHHGPWWALRAAWLVDVAVSDPAAYPAPCSGCAAPCVGGTTPSGDVMLASPEVRARCVLGAPSRYGREQIGYHYDREAALVALRAGAR